MKLQNDMLIQVEGGAITATLLNSVSRLISTVIEVGKMIGTSLNRVLKKNYCS